MVQTDIFGRPIRVGDFVAINGNPVKSGKIKSINHCSITVTIVGCDYKPNPNYNPSEYNGELGIYTARFPDKPINWNRRVPVENSLSLRKDIYVRDPNYRVTLIGDVFLGTNENNNTKETIKQLKL